MSVTFAHAAETVKRQGHLQFMLDCKTPFPSQSFSTICLLNSRTFLP